jgi:hypothetical protein
MYETEDTSYVSTEVIMTRGMKQTLLPDIKGHENSLNVVGVLEEAK